MKKLLMIFVFSASLATIAQHTGTGNISISSPSNMLYSDTSISNRILILERKLQLQEKQLLALKNENLQLKEAISSSPAKAEKKKKKFAVTRVGSKQWGRDYSEPRKPDYDSVDWNSLK